MSLTILIVDDEENARHHIRKYLENKTMRYWKPPTLRMQRTTF